MFEPGETVWIEYLSQSSNREDSYAFLGQRFTVVAYEGDGLLRVEDSNGQVQVWNLRGLAVTRAMRNPPVT